MANKKFKVKENVSGNFFVDESCIDCDACRKFAPDNFFATPKWSYVGKQPESLEEEEACTQALLSCPVGAIGSEKKLSLKKSIASFPLQLAPEVYLLGFNSKDSFGADSYFITSQEGNWMVDSPRHVTSLVDNILAMGGLTHIFLTHRDDVADSQLFAKTFGAKRIIHQSDLMAAKDSEIVLKSDLTTFQNGNAQIIFTPGHTEGHCILLWKEKYLFTGDHFSWSESQKRFLMFEDACWYDWDIQLQSLEKMMQLNLNKVEWVFPGHGRRAKIKSGEFPKILEEVLKYYKRK